MAYKPRKSIIANIKLHIDVAHKKLGIKPNKKSTLSLAGYLLKKSLEAANFHEESNDVEDVLDFEEFFKYHFGNYKTMDTADEVFNNDIWLDVPNSYSGTCHWKGDHIVNGIEWYLKTQYKTPNLTEWFYSI